jgi:molybdate transport system substrate-binding protein
MRPQLRAFFVAAVAVLALVMDVKVADAAEVKVVAANAVKEPFVELTAAFEKSTGHKVVAAWSGTAGIINARRRWRGN